MRQGHTLSTAPRRGRTRLPTHVRLRRADLSPLVFARCRPLLSAYRDAWASGVVLHIASHTMYLVNTVHRTCSRCLSLDAD